MTWKISPSLCEFHTLPNVAGVVGLGTKAMLHIMWCLGMFLTEADFLKVPLHVETKWHMRR